MRVVEATYLKYYREKIYNLIENKVIDEDVDSSILEGEQYDEYTRKDITYGATEEIKKFYEIYN